VLVFVFSIKFKDMDNLHNETLIPQAHVMVDFNVEFVKNPNDLDYCGSASTSTSIGCVGSPNITINGNLFTIVTIDEALWSTLEKQRDFWKLKSHNATTWAFMQETMCYPCVQEVPPSKMLLLEEQDGQTWKDHVHNFVPCHLQHMKVRLIHL
jgi:hypothetical protein